MTFPISTAVFEYFASRPEGPMWSLERAIKTAPQNVVSGLESLLEAISGDEVLEIQKDAIFHHLHDGSVDVDRAARIWFAERLLSNTIAQRKLALVRSETRTRRPAPYRLPALADVSVDLDHLVPLSAFQFDGSRLLRNGYAFCVLTTTSAPNSTYWLLDALYSEKLNTRASIRLDPFLFGPEDQFPAMFYRMWMYGKPINWERLAQLRQPEHGRWLADSLSRESEFTDFCWAPRSDGVHFVCEEVPKAGSYTKEPSRYLHAIYSPLSCQIGHLDGALRVFTLDEVRRRHALHVRNCGKLGVREKVFRIDQPIDRDVFSVVAQAFYVWNEDVRRYLTTELAPSVSASSSIRG
jgi:hypothetical protein